MTTAPFVIGIALALAVGAFGMITGLDRERAFYSTVLIVVGSYYALFAVQEPALGILAWETGGVLLFAAAAVIGFKTTPWVLVAALAAHGLFDAIHGHVLANPGTPTWWPAFCSAFDVTAAAWLAFRVRRVNMVMPSSRPRAAADGSEAG